MNQSELEVGAIYFGVTYEDNEYTRPIVHTYEYLGQSGSKTAPYLFRFVGSDDEVRLGERQLELMLDAGGLIELLQRFRDGKPMHPSRVS